MLQGTKGARALGFGIEEQRSSAPLALPAPPAQPAVGNLSFQISATLFTIMRLLGRVEAAKRLSSSFHVF